MISPCRIHRPRKLLDSLAFAFLFAAFLLVPRNEAIGQGATVPLDITAGVDIGYDDRVIGSTSSSGQGSFFAGEHLVLSYDRPRERTQLRLIGVARFDQFIDAGTDDKDVSVTLALTHNFSTRLSLRADVYAAYQTEPNFQSNVGPENVRAPHFDTHDFLSLSYQWLPRFATVTTYEFNRILYAQSSSVGTSSNRTQQTLGEQFRFSLTSRTNLIGQYRFETINYDSVPNNNSIIHFALAGVDHRLTEHIGFHVSGGESFRSLENDGDSVSPYFEGGVNYTRSNHSLNWTTSYGFEAPTAANVSTRKTWRSGLDLAYHLTSRIHSTATFYYNHNENEGSTSSGTGAQDSLQLTLGLNYTINRRLALHADYQHTMQSSQGSTSGYSRNRYSVGLSYTY
jgi:hypothetical protein